MISLTVFKSRFDSKTDKRMDFDSFEDFEQLLYNLSRVEYKRKEDAPLISPATYVTDDNVDQHPDAIKESGKTGKEPPWYHRKNRNVVDWGGWAALDVDDQKFEEDLKSDMDARFSGHKYICYSTASSTTSRPKFRLAFPLTRRVAAEEIRAFWFAMVSASGLSADTQCKDFSRMYYVPATYKVQKDTNNFIFSGSGSKPLDVDDLIRTFPAPPPKSESFFDNLPRQLQERVIEHRKQQMDNTDFKWTSYRNCPFWPKQLAAEYMQISDSGWYRKFYQIMVRIASNAIRNRYPITAREIAQLCFEFDADTGGWYKDRPFEREANGAIEFVYKNQK